VRQKREQKNKFCLILKKEYVLKRIPFLSGLAYEFLFLTANLNVDVKICG
jgi:hypothetical protein